MPLSKPFGFQNLSEFDAAWLKVTALVDAAAVTGAMEAAEIFIEEWKKRVLYISYRTGAYYDSIKIQKPATRTGALVELEVGTDLLYPTFLEYGTIKMDARPSMWPAFEATEAEMVKHVGMVIGAAALRAAIGGR